MSNDKPYACGTAAPIGFAVACGGASTAGGSPSVGIWRWKPSRSAVSPLRVYAKDKPFQPNSLNLTQQSRLHFRYHDD
ncbi:hypothetical protein [Brasilonema sennae]|uniref:hypothetical protein n=1 Tax=Brasilonema sennae TaxID=1397703 RepID=UPI00155AC56B|nr:hypothetical protein [Brasilonema sennae]